jgi:hypothetical protein
MCIFPTVGRQGFSKHVPVATNTHATTGLLDASFSVRPVSHQRKVGDYFFPELLVLYLFQKLKRKIYQHLRVYEVGFCTCIMTCSASFDLAQQWIYGTQTNCTLPYSLFWWPALARHRTDTFHSVRLEAIDIRQASMRMMVLPLAFQSGLFRGN